nr:sulfurtransferase TusA family protein [Chthonobacter rhizosphaerae]
MRLDLRGLNCPLPVLKTRRALARLAPGARVLVEATDPMSAIDLPHFCAESGHRLVDRATDGPVLRFLVEKGAG